MKRMMSAAASLSICSQQRYSIKSSTLFIPSTTIVMALQTSSPLPFLYSSTLTSSLRSSPPAVIMFYSSSTSSSNDNEDRGGGTDNFSRYSKFLVKNSNGVDGMGGQRGDNESEQDYETLLWLDSLGFDNNCIGETKNAAVESNTLHESSYATTTATIQQPPPSFSVLSWNILAQSLYESQYQRRRIQRLALVAPPSTSTTSPQASFQSLLSSSPHPHPWPKRLRRIIEILSHSKSDIICLQECEIQSFKDDIAPAMSTLGYDGVAQEDDRPNIPTTIKEATKHHRNPRNHIVATFWKRDKLEPAVMEAGGGGGDGAAAIVRTRSLTTVLRFRGDVITEGDRARDATNTCPTIAIINVHLEGNPRRFSERTRQLQHALHDLATRMEQPQKHNNNMQLDTLNALIIAGDFNCELQSSACSTYLRMGRLGRHAGLGGIHGEDAIILPPSFLESNEATEVIHPIMEWGRALPEEAMADIRPHPFRRNGMTSAYPKWLGKDNARSHFTFCSELTKHPVPGLDQIWFSSMTLKRTGLKRMFVNDTEVWERYLYDESEMEKWREEERRKVLASGLPSLDCKYPSDHLPIGATFDWKQEQDASDSSRSDERGGGEVRRLTIVDSEGNNLQQGKLLHYKQRVPQLEFEKPEDELNYLLEHCPYDSDEQASAVKFILSPITPPLSLSITSNETPTTDQMEQIDARHATKVELLSGASLVVRPWLKKIWKANKQVGKWNRHKLKHEARIGR